VDARECERLWQRDRFGMVGQLQKVRESGTFGVGLSAAKSLGISHKGCMILVTEGNGVSALASHHTYRKRFIVLSLEASLVCYTLAVNNTTRRKRKR
jgi:hypothetical protein